MKKEQCDNGACKNCHPERQQNGECYLPNQRIDTNDPITQGWKNSHQDMRDKDMLPQNQEKEWQKVFLDAGTREAYEDLSYMIKTVSDIISTQRHQAVAEFVERVKAKWPKYENQNYTTNKSTGEIDNWNAAISASWYVVDGEASRFSEEGIK